MVDDGRPEQLVVVAPGETNVALPGDLTVEDTVTVEAMVYDDDLCALRLATGALEVDENRPGRCLPAPNRSFATRIDAGAIAVPWTPMSELPPFFDDGAFAGLGECGGDTLGMLARGETPAPTATIEPPTVPAPPEPAMPPNFDDGPSSWETVAITDDVVARQPWARDAGDCPPGEVRFPGDAACHPLGTCPVGLWPQAYECQPGVAHVNPAVAVTGDGTCGSPFATIQEAIDTAEPVIALAKGTHVINSPFITSPTTIAGACPSMTIIDHQPTGRVLWLLRTTADLVIRDVTARTRDLGLWATVVDLSLERVRFDGGLPAVRTLRGATGTWTDVVVQNSTVAFELNQESDITAERVIVDGSFNGAVHVRTGSALRMSDFVVRDVHERPDENDIAVWADSGADLVLERGLIEDVEGTAVATSTGALEVTDVVVRNITPADAPGDAFSVPNAGAQFTRVFIDEVHHGGISNYWENRVGDVAIRDTVIRHVRPIPGLAEERAGHGVFFRGRALVAERVYVEDTWRVGFTALATASNRISHVVVDGVGQDDGQLAGFAIELIGPSVMDHVEARNAPRVGVGLQAGARVTISDLTVEGILNPVDGVGIWNAGTELRLDRARIENVSCGLVGAASDGFVIMADVDVRDIREAPATAQLPGSCGVTGGWPTSKGAAFTIDRLRLSGARGLTFHGNTSVVRDLIIEGADEVVPLLTAFSNADVEITRAVITGSSSNVIRVIGGSRLSLTDASIAPGESALDAIVVSRADSLTAERIDLTASRDVGLRACEGAAVTLVDSTIRSLHTAAELPRGFDVDAVATTRFEAARHGICDATVDPCSE